MNEPEQADRKGLRQQQLIVAVVVLVVILAAANWMLSPEEAYRWLGAMLFLPLLWLGMTFWHRHTLRSARPRGVDEEPIRRYFRSVLALIFLAAGLKLAVQFGLEIWVEFGDHRVDLDSERRILGLASGVALTIIGNALPKIVTPLSILPPGGAGRQSTARRFIGTTWVAIGLAVIVAYVALPVELAGVLRRWGTFASLFVVLAGIVWMNVGPAEQRR